MQTFTLSEEDKAQLRHVMEQARTQRERFLDSLRSELDDAITLIDKFDKKYVLGGLGARLLRATPNIYTEMVGDAAGDDALKPDDTIEVILEHAISIATASPNANKGVLPTKGDLEAIYEKLAKVKSNFGFYELTADAPKDGGESDHWIRTMMVQSTMNVRGEGYQRHMKEVFMEVFQPFDGFVSQYYGFTAGDLYDAIAGLDDLVYSKVGNPFGFVKAHDRFRKWSDKVGKEEIGRVMDRVGTHFIRQFTEVNPDLYDEEAPDQFVAQSLDRIASYPTIFWVIPQTDKDKLIYKRLALGFGCNSNFFEPAKFKGFPMNSSEVKLRPLIEEDGKYYHFSTNMGYRNVFKIAEHLIQEADATFHQQSFRGNSNLSSKDNYIEAKVRSQFQKMLPSVAFYSSLEYEIEEDGFSKRPELDVLGVSDGDVYIIEVKAGELNEKHRRGAVMGLKDRIAETIGEGASQCHRALKFIIDSSNPTFEYVEKGVRHTLAFDKTKAIRFHKICVTFEHFSSIAINVEQLVESHLLSESYRETWLLSLYDLMVFADIIESEGDLRDYLQHRMALNTRKDALFFDEIDILGFFLKGNFPLPDAVDGEVSQIIGFKEDIDKYFDTVTVGFPGPPKPVRTQK
ncbi:MAG: hypothetical protein IPN44_03670 [Flavobacteriales bacterium]|nr:hypothetical protein [Flavobacteriales bacterium]